MKLTDEMTLITKLRSLQVKCNAFDGLTTIDQRREIVRAALKPVEEVTFTVRDGKPITMAQQFQRVYEQPL